MVIMAGLVMRTQATHLPMVMAIKSKDYLQAQLIHQTLGNMVVAYQTP